jgi:hypothetical protein
VSDELFLASYQQIAWALAQSASEPQWPFGFETNIWSPGGVDRDGQPPRFDPPRLVLNLNLTLSQLESQAQRPRAFAAAQGRRYVACAGGVWGGLSARGELGT